MNNNPIVPGTIPPSRHLPELVLPDDAVAPDGQLRSAEATLPIGSRLGEFELRAVVGEGGFGIVYLAHDLQLDREVALKEYMPATLASRGPWGRVVVRAPRHEETFQAGLRSFVNEARLLARFDHPALVKVFRFWEDNGTAYMVMPYYRGSTLKEAVARLGGPPSAAWFSAVLPPLLDALQVLHSAQCYHRDVAPDNILLLDSGQPVLLDFGAARRVISDATQALTVILKPGFAPVEQYADGPEMRQGPWTDIYALAAVVYYCVTGKPPPPSIARLMRDTMASFSSVAPSDLDPVFVAAIDRALTVAVDGRFDSIPAFRSALGYAGWTGMATGFGSEGFGTGDLDATVMVSRGRAESPSGWGPSSVLPAQPWPGYAAPTEAPPPMTAEPESWRPDPDSQAARAAALATSSGGRSRGRGIGTVGVVLGAVAIGAGIWYWMNDEARDPTAPVAANAPTPASPDPVSAPISREPVPAPLPPVAAPPPPLPSPAAPTPAATLPAPPPSPPPVAAVPVPPPPPPPIAAPPAPPPRPPAPAPEASVSPVPAPTPEPPGPPILAPEARPSPAPLPSTVPEPTPPVVPDLVPESPPASGPAPSPTIAGLPSPGDPVIAQILDQVFDGRDRSWQVGVELPMPKVRIGRDRLEFRIRSDRPGYLYLLVVGTDGKHFHLLFPNGLDKANRLGAGTELRLPRPHWEMFANGPAGTNRFLAIVTPSPRTFPETGLDNGTPFREFDIAAARAAFARRGAEPFAGRPGNCGPDVRDCAAYGAAKFQVDEY